MHNSVLNNNPVLWDILHFTHIWKTLAWSHHFIKRAHKTNLTLPLFIEVPVPSQKSERSCFYDCPIGYWNRSDSVVFVFINKKRLLFMLDIQLKPLLALNWYISYLIFIWIETCSNWAFEFILTAVAKKVILKPRFNLLIKIDNFPQEDQFNWLHAVDNCCKI